MGLGLLTDQQPQSSWVLFQIGRFSWDESGSFENSLLDNLSGSSSQSQLVEVTLLTGELTTCDQHNRLGLGNNLGKVFIGINFLQGCTFRWDRPFLTGEVTRAFIPQSLIVLET